MEQTLTPAPSRLLTFYTLLVTQTFSLIGSRMTSVAVGIWLFAATGQVAPLLLVSFFNELPGMLLGSLAGVFIDRWSRKRVLMLADAGQAFGSLLLVASLGSGAFQVWHLYGVALLQGVFSTFQGPAESATITLLVPERHRERANGIKEVAHPLAGVIAPMLAGLFYALVGVVGVIAIDLVTFLLAVGVVAILHIPQPAATEEGSAGSGSLLAELRGGLAFFVRRPPLFSLVLYLTFMNFLLNGSLGLALPYMLIVTGDEARMGLLMGVMSAGAFAGSLLMVVLGGFRPRVGLLLAGALLSGGMYLFYGTAHSFWTLAVSIFLLMLPLPMTNALFNSILQVKTPPDLQGRVFSVYSQLAFLGSTTSFLLTGPLVDRFLEPALSRGDWRWAVWLVGAAPGSGMRLLLIATGLVMLLTTAFVFARPRVRQLETDLPDFPVETA